jgi:hypothetical protein
MGSGTYNASATRHLLSATRRAGGSVMGYTAAVNSGVVEAKVNSKLDPSKRIEMGLLSGKAGTANSILTVCQLRSFLTLPVQ